MVIGVGIDIVQNDRIERIINKWGDKFLKKFFSEKELAFITRTRNRNQRYAGNYAVKEAFAKAVGTGFRKGLRIRDIMVMRDSRGKPYVVLNGSARGYVEQIGANRIHTSISHEKDYSVAVVIVED